MGERRMMCEEYAEIGEMLIEKMPVLKLVRDERPGIIYLRSTAKKKSKGQAVLGECEKVQSKNKWAIPAEYEIVLYDPNIIGITDEQLEILIYHELLHIDIQYKDGVPVFGTKGHDVNEFKEIINKYGVEWAKGIGNKEDNEPVAITMEAPTAADEADMAADEAPKAADEGSE